MSVVGDLMQMLHLCVLAPASSLVKKIFNGSELVPVTLHQPLALLKASINVFFMDD